MAHFFPGFHEKNCQLKILYPAKRSSFNEGEIQDILKLKKTENLPPAGMAKGSSLHRKEIIKEGLLETQEGERSMERVKI